MRQLSKSIFVLLAGFVLGFTQQALAEDPTSASLNSIESIQTQLDGGKLLLKVQLKQALAAVPGNWSTTEPARIVFDFPQTENKTGKNSQLVNTADLRSFSLVQAENLTRLVLNLSRNTGYTTTLDGNALFIALEPFTPNQVASAAVPVLLKEVAVSKSLDEPALLRDLSFRRGADGQALIRLDLSDGRVPVDIRRSAAGLTIDIQKTEIAERLLNKRDVNDFATPVSTIESTMRGKDHAVIVIATKGRWIHQAQMVDNQLTVELKPLTEDEANKLVPVGQEGKKISVNFYDAELPMVLRTLAELSGRNVIVDPSLSGKKITITLENMPYDQALDLVMVQTGASMRVKPNLVLFAARDLLLKRDAEAAEELSRANETSPLVVETFQLNYIQASDLIKLILLAQSPTSNSTPTPTQVTTPSGSGGMATTVANLPRGLLSPRGSISNHDITNKLFVRDTQQVIDQIRNLIKDVDVPPKQVMVEARIVEVSTDFTSNLGVRLNLFDTRSYQVGNSGQNIGFGTYSAGSTVSTGNTAAIGTSYSLTGTTTANLMLFNNAATRILTMELAASEIENKSKTVSSPRVVTQNRKAAKIDYTQQTTLVVGMNAQTGLPIYQTYSAPLTLEVTPSITPDNRVNLDLKINKSTLNLASGGSNTLNTNTLNTNVMVENGGTVVIGGFYIEGDSSAQERVPLLGDLPYVGFLFKTTTKLRSKSELLVFITPRVMSENLALR